jgi:hypothetical protein
MPSHPPPNNPACQPKQKSAFDALMQPQRSFSASKAAAQTDVYAVAQVVFVVTASEQQQASEQAQAGAQGPPAANNTASHTQQNTLSTLVQPAMSPAAPPDLFSPSLLVGLSILLNPQVQGDVLIKWVLGGPYRCVLLYPGMNA